MLALIRNTCMALLAVAQLVLLVGRAGGEEKPYGLQKRPAWTNTRLVGSPEPPSPYTVERTFTNIAWKAPLYLAEEPGTGCLWVIQQGGEAERPSTMLRIKNAPAASTTETVLEVPRRLVYSVAFHPRYVENGYVYVFSNGPTPEPEKQDRVSRFTVNRAAPKVCDPKSEVVLVQWPSAGHDGGDLAFGADRMLYITTGDGTSDSDGWVTGQTLDDLLGAVLRIDVDQTDPSKPYAVPPDNPFVNHPGARGEIWAYGLRNPWRMSFDAASGQLWVGTNGQDLWETAHLVHRGDNFGWSVYEGSHPFYMNRKLGPTPPVKPTIEHHHSEFRSLTGGVVYHGQKFPELEGAYVYGDYSTGRIWAMKHDGQRPLWHRELADTPLQIAAFCCVKGELLVVDVGGGINRLITAPKQETTTPFPTRLSETGLFDSVREHRVAPGLVPYSVNAPGWADGAQAERLAAVPDGAHVVFSTDKLDPYKSWTFPDRSVLVQTLSLSGVGNEPTATRRIETRVLVLQQGEWAGYTYRWNDDESDAVLVPKHGAETVLAVHDRPAPGGSRRQTWRFPSRSECLVCHSRAANFVLGLSAPQMDRERDYGGVRDNQLRAWEHAGMFSAPLPDPPVGAPPLADPYDSSAPLEARARAYLHVNCSVCHVWAGGGNSQINLSLATPLEKANLIAARPQHDTFGIDDAMLVAPARPDRSIVVHRIARRGRGQMPPLVSARVDDQAVRLLREWIAGMKPARPFVRDWKLDDFAAVADEVKNGRSSESGKTAFREIGCAQCHRLAGEGGSVGPDLTGIGHKQTADELLKSILLPSDKVADEYALHQVETDSGKVLTGRIEREDDAAIVIRPLEQDQVRDAVRLPKAQVTARSRLPQSNMPLGIVNVLKREEVLDLLAYLMSVTPPETAAGGK